MSFYDFEEYDRLVVAAKALDPATHLLVLLGAEAGLRCGEMIALKWTDVNLGNQQLCIQRSAWKGQETTPKGGRLRYVKMTTRLATALREHRHLRSPYVLCQDDLRPLTRPVVQYRIKRAALAADLPPKGVHILRHTFCSHLAMLGASMSVTQALVGHAGLTMTRRYTHLSPAALEGAVALLDERAAKTEGNMVASGSTAVAKVNG
jgi:integrase